MLILSKYSFNIHKATQYIKIMKILYWKYVFIAHLLSAVTE